MSDSSKKHISELIKVYLKSFRMDGKIQEIKLVNDWEDLFGKTINRYTKSIKLHSGILYVYLSSSVLRQELHYNRDTMKTKINEHFGETLIRDIVLR